MFRKLALLVILIGFSHPLSAACSKAMIGHIVDKKGDWVDEQYNKRTVEKGVDVCSDSKLVRRRNPSDSDRLEVQPMDIAQELVLFACRDGVTCVRSLNLGRIPISTFSNSPLVDIANALSRKLQEWRDDHQRLESLLHRGERTVGECYAAG